MASRPRLRQLSTLLTSTQPYYYTNYRIHQIVVPSNAGFQVDLGMFRRVRLCLLLILACNIGWPQSSTSEIEEALYQLSDSGKVDFINQNFYSIYSANFGYSLTLTRKAAALSEENNWPKREALSKKNLGIILYLSGDYEPALRSYLSSFDLYDSLGDKSGLAQVSNELANYHRKQGEYQKALDLWALSERLATEADDLRTLGTSLGMQATFYRGRGNYRKSDPLFIRCYEIRKIQNDSVGLGYVLLDIADIERRKGNLTEALAFFDQSTTIRQRIGDDQGVLENYKALGDLFIQESQYVKAAHFYDQAVRGSLNFGYPDLARISLDSLSSTYALLGDFRRSLGFKVRAENIEDSLFNMERSRAISELQTQHETEKKEQQIALQNAQIDEQEAIITRNSIALIAALLALILIVIIGLLLRSKMQRKQHIELQETQLQARKAEIHAAISSQEQERARYARDLHDGFGQLISIIKLNLHRLQSGTDLQERERVFNTSAKAIDSMYDELRRICFDLMPHTLIHQGLSAALREFCAQVNETGQLVIDLDLFGLEKRLENVQEISLYRIIQEWINNIIKHGEARKVTVQITTDDHEITMIIEDDAMGFDSQLLTAGSGNGWKNINTRTRLIMGTLELETLAGRKGNTLIINAPKRLPATKATENTTITV